MKLKLMQELAFITGSFVIIALLAKGFATPCGPGCDFMPMLVMAGGAGLTMLAPLSGISRIVCVIALILALVGAHSEWQTGERFRKRIDKQMTDDLIKRFEIERAEWERNPPASPKEPSP